VLKSVYDILPLYVGRRSGEERENGKRKHGRGGDLYASLEQLQKMSTEGATRDGQGEKSPRQ